MHPATKDQARLPQQYPPTLMHYQTTAIDMHKPESNFRLMHGNN